MPSKSGNHPHANFQQRLPPNYKETYLQPSQETIREESHEYSDVGQQPKTSLYRK